MSHHNQHHNQHHTVMESAESQHTQSPSPSVEIVRMTPEWAQKLLNRNPRNRRLNLTRIQMYAEDMKRGSWQLSPEPIALDTDGVLLNGQHRLKAVVESGATVQMLIGTGFRPECFSVIDTGAARSMSDIITIRHKAGHSPGDNYSPITCSAILRTVLLAEKYPNNIWTGPEATKLTVKSILLQEFDANEEEYRSAAKTATDAHNKFKYVSRPALGALVVLAKRLGCHDVDHYVEIVGTGAGLQKGSPVLAFRTYLLNGSGITSTSKRPQDHLAMLIKNFRQWREGAQIVLFKAPAIVPLPRLRG